MIPERLPIESEPKKPAVDDAYDAQRYQLAQMARDGEMPLLSDKTIMADILGIRDPDLEQDQVDREWAERLPINRLMDAYFRAVEVQDMLKANNFLLAVKQLMQPMGAQGGKGGARGAPSQYQQQAGEAGMTPVQKTGVPSSTMPAEAGGGFPPGASNARMTGEGEV